MIKILVICSCVLASMLVVMSGEHEHDEIWRAEREQIFSAASGAGAHIIKLKSEREQKQTSKFSSRASLASSARSSAREWSVLVTALGMTSWPVQLLQWTCKNHEITPVLIVDFLWYQILWYRPILKTCAVPYRQLRPIFVIHWLSLFFDIRRRQFFCSKNLDGCFRWLFVIAPSSGIFFVSFRPQHGGRTTEVGLLNGRRRNRTRYSHPSVWPRWRTQYSWVLPVHGDVRATPSPTNSISSQPTRNGGSRRLTKTLVIVCGGSTWTFFTAIRFLTICCLVLRSQPSFDQLWSSTSTIDGACRRIIRTLSKWPRPSRRNGGADPFVSEDQNQDSGRINSYHTQYLFIFDFLTNQNGKQK